MARMLASVQKCVEVRPIEGADSIEMVRVLGWECVVKKGVFKPEDLGVYIEVDSIVPDIPAFSFMKDRKFRVRTIRLRGQISQGLFMPFEDLNIRHYSEGRDITALLNIQKWEPPEEGVSTPPQKKSLWWKLVYTLPFLAFLRKKVGEGTAFPTHLVPKTDETRVQAFPPDFFEKYRDVPISITQKMDGSSCTFIWNKGKFSVASRNVWFIENNGNSFWKLAEEINIASAMKKVFGKRNIVLQGEMCGPNIQGNKYLFDKKRFFLFGAYDSNKKEYFTPSELLDAYGNLFDAGSCLEIVNEIETLRSLTMKDFPTVDDWILLSKTRSMFNPETWNEGIVVRSLDNKPYGVRGMNGRRFSFKVINPEFLLQYKL